MNVNSVTDEWRRVVGELTTLRDDAKVRAHLLSQEASQQLSKLELEIENLQLKAIEDDSSVTEQALSTARRLTHALAGLLEGKPNQDEASPRPE